MPRRISGVFENWTSAYVDDLHVVAPRVEERVAAEDLHAGLAGRGEHRVAIVDDEPEVARGVGALRPCPRRAR